MANVPFDVGHLHVSEQDRIREGNLNPDERAKLMRGENPWPKPVSPKSESPPPPKPDPVPLVDLFDEKGYQDTQRRLNKLVHGDGPDSPNTAPKREKFDGVFKDIPPDRFQDLQLSSEDETSASQRDPNPSEDEKARALKAWAKEHSRVPFRSPTEIDWSPLQPAMEAFPPVISRRPNPAPSSWSVWVQRGALAVAGGLAWWLFEKFDAPVWLVVITLLVCLGSVLAVRWLEKTRSRRNWFIAFLVIYAVLAVAAAVVFRKRGDSALPTQTANVPSQERPMVQDSNTLERRLLQKTPHQLLSLYDGRTRLQADKLMEPYKGEWIRVAGTLHQVTPTRDTIVVLLEVIERGHSDMVGATFAASPEKERKLMRLDKGTRITIEGQISTTQEGDFLYLINCEYIQ
jgi:tRNA_anti-like